MAESLLPGRARYVPGGGTRWRLFLPLTFLLFGAALFFAWLLHRLNLAGHYYLFLMPAMSALAVGGLLYLAVARGHCRNPWMAGVVGVAAGCGLYLGYYYVGMAALVQEAGGPIAPSLTLLPSYVCLRMEMDIVSDAHDSRPGDPEKARQPWRVAFKWLCFAGELVFVAGVIGGAGWRRARKPYCEHCRQWMERQLTGFETGQIEALVSGLREDAVAGLAALCRTPPQTTPPNLTAALDFCPGRPSAEPASCRTYLSLKKVMQNSGGVTWDVFEGSKGPVLFRAVRLSDAERAALGPRFPLPALSLHSAPAAVKAVLAVTGVAVAQGPPLAITPVEPQYAGRILSRRNQWIGTVLGLSQLLFFGGAIGLAAWGGLAAFPEHPPAGGVSPAMKMLGLSGLVVGATAVVLLAPLLFLNAGWLNNRWLWRVARQEVRARPFRQVDPDRPETYYVEVVPKANWNKLMLDTASDLGFLHVDRVRREIVFEGDRERYRLPAVALTSCQSEVQVQGEGTHGKTKLYYTVLRGMRAGTFWEAPLRIRAGRGLFFSRSFARANAELVRKVTELRTPS